MKSIILVEYDRLLAETYAKGLAKNYQVFIAKRAQEALDFLDAKKPDALVFDVVMGRHSGIELLHEVRSHDDWLDIPIIIISSLPLRDFPISQKQWKEYQVEVYFKPEITPKLLSEKVKELIGE